MPDELEQRFRKNYPIEPEEKVPECPGRIRILSGIQRSIAFLYGLYGSAAKRLVCDSAGRLVTAGGSDGSTDRPLLTDSSGRVIARIAYTGAADTYLLVDATGKLIALVGNDGTVNRQLLTGATGIIRLPSPIEGPGSPVVDSYNSAVVDCASGATTAVIAAPGAGKQLWVYGLFGLTNTAGATIVLLSATTAKSGTMPLAQYGGWVLPLSGNFAMPWVKCGTNEALNVTTVGGTFDGVVSYGVISV